MAQLQTSTTCDDCIEILNNVISLLSSKSAVESSVILVHTSYQTRLAVNVSSSKCHMCTLLCVSTPRLLDSFESREILVLSIRRTPHDPDAATVSLVGFEGDTTSGYGVSLRIQDGEKEAKVHNYGIVKGKLMVPVEHGKCQVSTLSSSRTWSLETLNRIRSWVKSCTLTHDNCARPQAVIRLPRRLIDVMSARFSHIWPMEETGPEDFNLLSLEEFPNVRIVSSKCLSPDTPYLTLSHRWGNPPSILLSKKSLFLLDDDISPHLLNCGEAAVFRHAIHVTRGLGFRYIWIDALCIMQDDDSEKTADIMQMDEIYLNSTLNISAAEGRNREGLIFDRKILCTSPCRARVRVPKAQEDIYLQVFPEKCFLRSSENPLNERGWVFQERALAPRIVHFTKDQVFWECHSLEASEVLPHGLPDRPSTYLGKGLKISPASSMQQLKSRWYETVEEYSPTSLTFVDDRLLAISAMAKRFCSAMRSDPSEYLAGMWKDDLPLSMLWSQDPDTDMSGSEPMTSSAAEMKHAPSWSWASVLSSVSFVEPSSLAANAEVLDVQIARISRNFFDGAHSCRLRLRGPVCKFSRCVRDGGNWIHIGQHTKFQEFSGYRFPRDRAMIIMWDTSRKVVADWLKTLGTRPATATYFLLHVASKQSVDGLMEDGPLERGLVLRRIAAHGTYARIGSFFINDCSEYAGSELEEAFDGRLNTLSTDDYFELDSGGRYVIDIV